MAFRQTLPNGKTVEFQSPPTEADIFEAYTQTNGNLEGYGGEQVIKDIDSSLAMATMPQEDTGEDPAMLMNRRTGEMRFQDPREEMLYRAKIAAKYRKKDKDVKDITPLQAMNILKDPFASKTLSPKVYKYLKEKAEMVGQEGGTINTETSQEVDTDWDNTNF